MVAMLSMSFEVKMMVLESRSEAQGMDLVMRVGGVTKIFLAMHKLFGRIVRFTP